MFGLDIGLFVTIAAVAVAGLAAVLGIWMERDKQKPPRYAYALSILILLTTMVSLAQAYIDERQGAQLEDDMARMLQTMDKLASETDDPRLAEMVKSELSAQSRSNPEVVEKLAQRVSDDGEDPAEVLGKHLGAAEVEKVARAGTIKPKETTTEKPKPKPDAKEADAEGPELDASAGPPAAGGRGAVRGGQAAPAGAVDPRGAPVDAAAAAGEATPVALPTRGGARVAPAAGEAAVPVAGEAAPPAPAGVVPPPTEKKPPTKERKGGRTGDTKAETKKGR